MRWVDTHCHLQHTAFDADRDLVLDRALDELEWLVVVGDDVATSQSAAAASRACVYATAGIHPHNAKYADAEAVAVIRNLAQLPHVVAIGEIGLDYHYDFSPRDQQRAALRSQIELAVDLRLPAVFHCREAEDDFAAIVEPRHAALTAGIMHCFGGDAAFVERCLGWGFYVSFAGNVTFPKAHALREALCRVPPDRLLIETDSPYLAPQRVRGKRCEPVHVRYTAEAVAALRGVSPETLAQQTTSNARQCFRVDSLRGAGSEEEATAKTT